MEDRENSSRTSILPLWKRILIVPVLIAGLSIPGLLLLSLYVGFVIPPAARLCPVGTAPVGVIVLLILIAALFACMLVLIVRKKHRILAAFFAVLSVFLAIKTIPRLDNEAHAVVPELVAVYTVDDIKGVGFPDIYFASFFVGSSMRSGPQSDLPAEVRAELEELISDHRYTWIVSADRELTEISWSPEHCVQYLFWPWTTGLVYEEIHVGVPGEKNTLYVYRIPLAPIDNIF